jgi:hypothetical protein
MEKSDLERIAGRVWAEEVIDDLAAEPEHYREGFWREVGRHIPRHDPVKLGLMSDEQAQEFGRQAIGFGQYADERYDEVPLDYLEWLVDSGAELSRYVGSRRVQAERSDTD